MWFEIQPACLPLVPVTQVPTVHQAVRRTESQFPIHVTYAKLL